MAYDENSSNPWPKPLIFVTHDLLQLLDSLISSTLEIALFGTVLLKYKLGICFYQLNQGLEEVP
jgi:hypothetical protein